MVGDVKQSIYRFRQAMPEIFWRKKRTFARYDPDRQFIRPRSSWDGTFAARRESPRGINFVFSQLMSEDIGEMTYGEEERLIPAASFPEDDAPRRPFPSD